MVQETNLPEISERLQLFGDFRRSNQGECRKQLRFTYR